MRGAGSQEHCLHASQPADWASGTLSDEFTSSSSFLAFCVGTASCTALAPPAGQGKGTVKTSRVGERP